jgi:Kef-type K+ transport system membrane component KefB
LLVLLALGFVVTDFLKYVHLDPLLTFMVAGFVVQNMTAQGPAMLRTIEQVGGVVFVVFFGTAGAHLDVPLLKEYWPIALSLCGARAMFTLIAARIASRYAEDVPMVRRWGFSSLVSQAGLALGIAMVIVKAFPSVGAGFSAMAIAAVAVNEMVGPVLFKFALDRAGETHSEEQADRASLAPPAH